MEEKEEKRSFLFLDAIKGHDSLVSMFHARTHIERESNQVKMTSFLEPTLPPHPSLFLPTYTHTHPERSKPDGVFYSTPRKK